MRAPTTATLNQLREASAPPAASVEIRLADPSLVDVSGAERHTLLKALELERYSLDDLKLAASTGLLDPRIGA